MPTSPLRRAVDYSWNEVSHSCWLPHSSRKDRLTWQPHSAQDMFGYAGKDVRILTACRC